MKYNERSSPSNTSTINYAHDFDGFDESFTSAANVDDGMAWQWVQVGKSTEERSLLVAAMVKMATVTRIMKYNKYDEDQDDYGAEVQDDHLIMVDKLLTRKRC